MQILKKEGGEVLPSPEADPLLYTPKATTDAKVNENLEPKYLNEYHKQSEERKAEYIRNMKLPLSLEEVIQQQLRNSKDKSPDTKKKDHYE